jgi:hypothetical protein
LSGAGLLWLGSFLLLALTGAPLLLHPAFSRMPPAGRALLAGAAGAALTSFAMTAAALLGIRWSVPALLAAAALLALALRSALGAASNRSPETPNPAGTAGPRTAMLVAAVLCAVAVAAALLATAAGSASSPDLLFFWGPKAQQFAASRTVDAAYLAQPLLRYMHPYYPPLVTNLYALASIVAGRMSWTAATFLFPSLLAALAVGLPGILRTAMRPLTASATTALAVCAIACVGMEADIGGNAEMPLLLFETLGVAVLLSPLAEGPAGQLLGGLLLSAVVSAKVEGLPFALAAVAAFVWMRRRSSSPGPALARLLGPAALALGAWFAFGQKTHLFRGYSGEGGLLRLHLENAPAAANAIAVALASTGYGLPYLVPLICLIVAWRELRADAALPLVTAAGLTAFLLFTYVDRPGDPSLWIAWSAPRVFSPLAVLFALAAACARDEPEAGARETPRPPSR